jgi:hypothetical protein
VRLVIADPNPLQGLNRLACARARILICQAGSDGQGGNHHPSRYPSQDERRCRGRKPNQLKRAQWMEWFGEAALVPGGCDLTIRFSARK